MIIKFEKGKLKLSTKTKFSEIMSLTVIKKKNGSFSVYYGGVDRSGCGVRYTLSAKKVRFEGIEFVNVEEGHAGFDVYNYWEDKDFGVYINYYEEYKK